MAKGRDLAWGELAPRTLRFKNTKKTEKRKRARFLDVLLLMPSFQYCQCVSIATEHKTCKQEVALCNYTLQVL